LWFNTTGVAMGVTLLSLARLRIGFASLAEVRFLVSKKITFIVAALKKG
jgi:hypothetical protein